ncbi:glutamate--cysteine ligase [Pedomonas mirosovicensis]|uniref:glutamate--cysteine ligase n=1 Tax=Pedomonas mirosovicensis TaxID=2908641 RepID=UPI00216919E1|nr:glutamate--cysteine ligase [Pedomonas mirosovicensis]MCH8686027.1 glutamate--cysteine ligase [Pedomonas mirosovicensis]
MSTRVTSSDDEQTLESKATLVEYLASGSKPEGDWRLGTEHEKFVYKTADLRPPRYDEPGGIRDILSGLARLGWEPIEEGGNVIALKQGSASVSLEPGGQLELSGAPVETVHDTFAELQSHLRECLQVGQTAGVGFLGHGFIPNRRRDEMPVMPKGRYKIMMNYMPKVGSLGLDMMFRTSTVQVNLDFGSEADMARKFRVGLALQPVATALFANSPFTEGKPNGFLSFRSHIWTDTDPDRTGMLPFVFEDGFGFERYADYMLDVPMYFVFRDGKYIDVAGQSFRDFMDGRLAALPGERPTLADWKDHLSTAFPEVRLKTFLEMRGADSGPADRIVALPALWAGLLYDRSALDAAWDLVKDWTNEEHEQLRRDVPRLGLKTPFRGGTLADIARRTVAIAEAGLNARARLTANGESEAIHLAALHEIAESGITPAERLLTAYHGPWHGDVTRLFAEESF